MFICESYSLGLLLAEAEEVVAIAVLAGECRRPECQPLRKDARQASDRTDRRLVAWEVPVGVAHNDLRLATSSMSGRQLG